MTKKELETEIKKRNKLYDNYMDMCERLLKDAQNLLDMANKGNSKALGEIFISAANRSIDKAQDCLDKARQERIHVKELKELL